MSIFKKLFGSEGDSPLDKDKHAIERHKKRTEKRLAKEQDRKQLEKHKSQSDLERDKDSRSQADDYYRKMSDHYGAEMPPDTKGGVLKSQDSKKEVQGRSPASFNPLTGGLASDRGTSMNTSNQGSKLGSQAYTRSASAAGSGNTSEGPSSDSGVSGTSGGGSNPLKRPI